MSVMSRLAALAERVAELRGKFQASRTAADYNDVRQGWGHCGWHGCIGFREGLAAH